MGGDVLTLSVGEAATRLGIGIGAAYRLVREGRLPAIRVGRRYRVVADTLPELLANPAQLSLDGRVAAVPSGPRRAASQWRREDGDEAASD